MTKLVTASQFADPDAAYVALVEARRSLDEQAAAALDVRVDAPSGHPRPHFAA